MSKQDIEQNNIEVEPKPAPIKKPKKKCSSKQLAALAAGRAKNPRFRPKKANAKSKEDVGDDQGQE